MTIRLAFRLGFWQASAMFARVVTSFGLLSLLGFALPACGSDEAAGDEEGSELPGEDLGLGELGADDLKADGNWGQATTCKAAPNLPPLAKPRITVSLNGLTLHLVDDAGSYDKVFPIGPGAINQTAGEKTFGESRTMYPLLSSGGGDFQITPATTTACKIWWTDKETGETLPVFAGLPFLSWSGPYAIHGPVDNYRAADGGNLRRGFVSHGCVRMRGADVLEVYARIKGVAKVPVHVQREAERGADGRKIDVPETWLGAECVDDADCTYAGGVCKTNRYSERGFCTKACTGYCPDQPGQPTSFCVADPDAPAKGMCVLKSVAENYGCRPYDHMVPATEKRLGSTVTAKVCRPGSPGGIGDHCLADGECGTAGRCEGEASGAPGTCTTTCQSTCPDTPGYPTTACVNDAALGGLACARRCTVSSNQSECPENSTCTTKTKAGSTKTVSVCLPN